MSGTDGTDRPRPGWGTDADDDRREVGRAGRIAGRLGLSENRRDVVRSVADTHGVTLTGMAATAVSGGGTVAWTALVATAVAAFVTEARRVARRGQADATGGHPVGEPAGQGSQAIRAAVGQVEDIADEVEALVAGAVETLRESRERIRAVSEDSASDLPGQIDALLADAIELLHEAREDIQAGVDHARAWAEQV